MFWDKGYTPSQNIEALLEKENSTVEEFLDDDDILQECKTLKKSIVKYFIRPEVIKRLIEIITTEPSEELPLAQRFRHANMACEILTLGLPSLDEKIIADPDTLKILYSYLENEPPLNPLLSSFFHKTFCMLFTKKPEQDWFLYQQMCLQLLEYLKSRKDFLDLIFKHFATPVIPELVLQLLKDFEGGQLKRNLYEWLTEEKLVERLIAILGNPDECDKHSNVTEFLCDLIKQGRTMRQTEHENDSFEPAFDGSNPILKTLESEVAIEALLNVILEPNAQESAIVSGISVVLTLIKPNPIVDEAYSDRSKLIQNREKDIHEQISATVIRVMSPRLNELNQLLKSPPTMSSINTTAAKLEPPFGLTRLQVCRVFTVLLQMKNEEIEKAICETDFFETLLSLFKQYCWNNFLHSEVEKCMQIIFESASSNNNNNSAQGSTIVNDGSISKSSLNGDNTNGISSSFFDCMIGTNGIAGGGGGGGNNINEANMISAPSSSLSSSLSPDHNNIDDDVKIIVNDNSNLVTSDKDATTTTTTNSTTAAQEQNDVESKMNNEIEIEKEKEADTDASSEADKNLNDSSIEMNEVNEEESEEEESNIVEQTEREDTKDELVVEQMEESNEDHSLREKDSMKSPTDMSPSALQKHLITNCKLITKLIDCWNYNSQMECAEKGRRLGYMGYLIKTLRHITNCISESEHIGALIESNLSDESEHEKWHSITDAKDGDLTKTLATQNRLLANCNAHEACDFGHHLPKDFLSDNSTWDYIMSSNMLNNLGGFSDSNFIETNHDFDNNFELEDDDDDDELAGAIGGIAAGAGVGSGTGGLGNSLTPNSDGSLSFFGKGSGSKTTPSSTTLQSLSVGNGLCSNPWYDVDPFANLKVQNSSSSSNPASAAAAVGGGGGGGGPWTSDFTSDNFADFDSHFSTFTSDLGESLTATKDNNGSRRRTTTTNIDGSSNGIENDECNGGTANKMNSINAAGDGGVCMGVGGVGIGIGGIVVGDRVVGFKNHHEIDNNANVEKLPITFDDLALKNEGGGGGVGGRDGGGNNSIFGSSSNNENKDGDDHCDVIVPQSLARTLHSVMHESEDDYEDDDGMWTKPLGQQQQEHTPAVQQASEIAMDSSEGGGEEIKVKSPIDTSMVNGTNEDDDDEGSNNQKCGKSDEEHAATAALAGDAEMVDAKKLTTHDPSSIADIIIGEVKAAAATTTATSTSTS